MLWIFTVINLGLAFLHWRDGDVAMTNLSVTIAAVFGVGAYVLGELRGR